MFLTYNNETGFADTPGLTTYVVLIGALFGPIVFTGFEASGTLAEETINGGEAAA